MHAAPFCKIGNMLQRIRHTGPLRSPGARLAECASDKRASTRPLRVGRGNVRSKSSRVRRSSMWPHQWHARQKHEATRFLVVLDTTLTELGTCPSDFGRRLFRIVREDKGEVASTGVNSESIFVREETGHVTRILSRNYDVKRKHVHILETSRGMSSCLGMWSQKKDA
eukprot:579230-Pleurochrysis_carterae.AAC.1